MLLLGCFKAAKPCSEPRGPPQAISAMSDGRVTVGHCIEGLPMGLFVACRGGAQRVGRLYQESYRSYMKLHSRWNLKRLLGICVNPCVSKCATCLCSLCVVSRRRSG